MIDYIRMLILVHKQKKEATKSCWDCKHRSVYQCRRNEVILCHWGGVCKYYKVSIQELERMKYNSRLIISKYKSR